MKKILETQEGRLGKIIFKDNGNGILDGNVETFMKKKCEIYSDSDGVIVQMTKREYEEILKEEDNYKGYQAMLRQYDKK